MMKEEDLGRLSELLSILGVESRLRIIDLLLECDSICVNGLAKRLGISQSAVSQHLRLLSLEGLVSSVRHGYFTHYSVDREKLEEMLRLLRMLTAERDGTRSRCTPDGGETCAEEGRNAAGRTS